MRNLQIIRLIVYVIIIAAVFQLINVSKKVKPKPKITPTIEIKGKIAIVIDDWGYNLNNVPILSKLQSNFTAAVLPNVAYSKEISKELSDHGEEVILHLPLEPLNKNKLKYSMEKDTILTSMPEVKIIGILRDDLNSIHNVKGVSNHMGSKATENEKTMGVIFDELLKHKMYFLDSNVTSRSICYKLAKKKKLPFARGDVFLDNKNDATYIRKQFELLKRQAKAKGYAVGIGHDRKITMQVVSEMMPQLEKEGFKLVLISDIVKAG